jgi:hypothetical protein
MLPVVDFSVKWYVVCSVAEVQFPARVFPHCCIKGRNFRDDTGFFCREVDSNWGLQHLVTLPSHPIYIREYLKCDSPRIRY